MFSIVGYTFSQANSTKNDLKSVLYLGQLIFHGFQLFHFFEMVQRNRSVALVKPCLQHLQFSESLPVQ